MNEIGILVLGNLMDESNKEYAGYRVYAIDGICPSICASGFKKDIYIFTKSIDKLDNSVYNEVID